MSSHFKKIFTVLFAFVFVTQIALAEEHTAPSQESKKEQKGDVNIKDMIFEHVLDSYEWHLSTMGEHHISIPLPIIVKSKETGWNVFSSAKLRDGKEYEGFYISEGEKNHGKVVEKNVQGEEIRPLDLSITKNAFSVLMSCVILLLVLFYVASFYKKNPLRSAKGFRGAIEQLTMYMHDEVIKPSIGNGYEKYAPYLLTVFFFILLNNLLGLIPIFPGGANVTGNITITMILAVLTFLITNFSGNKEYWKEVFWPDVPVFLKTPVFPLMQFIEIIGIIVKPIALMIRLFANMLAGHMVVLVFMGLIFIFAMMMGLVAGVGVSVFSIAFSIFMLLLDVLVSLIQAYVFTMLSALFIGLARPEHHATEKNH